MTRSECPRCMTATIWTAVGGGAVADGEGGVKIFGFYVTGGGENAHWSLALDVNTGLFVGLLTARDQQFSEVVVDCEQNRILFFRPCDGRPGVKLRIEIPAIEKPTFVIRRNTTAWKFDDWKLEGMVHL